MISIIKTGVLLAALTALFVGAGFLIAGEIGMIVALVLALGLNVFTWWNSGDLILQTYRAREVTRTGDPGLYGLVAGLARDAGLPMPKVYVIDGDQPNAFATGRDPDHAAVAVTTGLRATLTPEQLAGVISHELAHIRNYDTLIMTVAATLAGAVAALADVGLIFGGDSRDQQGQPTNGPGLIGGLLLMILAPLAAALVQMAISRTREYEADRIGAGICGPPAWLADALVRIHQGVRHFVNPAAEVNPATAHLFIMNPLHDSPIAGLFATHPSTAERVRRLRLMIPGGVGGAIGRLARATPPA